MGAVQVEELDEIMVITDNGTLVRTRVNEVSVIGRNTQGVRLIRTTEDEHVVALQRIDEVEEPTEFEGDDAESHIVEGEIMSQENISPVQELDAQQASEDSSTDDEQE